MSQPVKRSPNLRDSRRELARASRGAVAAQPDSGVAKRVPPSPENPQYTRSSYTALPDQKLYEAVGGCGAIAVRSSKGVMTVAIDVSDVAGGTTRKQQGQIWAFYPNVEAAEKQAERLRAQGYTVKIVPAKPYEGPTQ